MFMFSAQSMACVTANGGDCAVVRNSSVSCRLMGIAAAVSFLFALVLGLLRLPLLALLIMGLGSIALILRSMNIPRE